MKILVILSLLAFMIGCEDQLIKGETKVERVENLCPETSPETEPSEVAFAGINEVTNITQTSVTLNWLHQSGLNHYNIISYSTTGRKLIKRVNAPKTKVVINNLTPDTEYQFLVRAMDEKGYIDANTNIVTVRTNPWPTYLNQKSISFNGNQSINIGASSNFKTSKNLSVAMWIKPDLTNVSSEVRLATFHSGPNAGTAVSLGITKTKIVFNYRDLTNQLNTFEKEVSLDDNSWHHIATTIDATSAKIYVDGQSIAIIRAQIVEFGAHAAHLGAYTGSQKGFVGLMDEVSIFSAYLSNSEVAALNSSKASQDPRDFVSSNKLLSWYRMGDSNDDSAANIDDITGANNGSPLNMTRANFVIRTP